MDIDNFAQKAHYGGIFKEIKEYAKVGKEETVDGTIVETWTSIDIVDYR